jgi:hypothetical protein
MPFTLNTDWRFGGDMVGIFAEASQISHQGQLYPQPGHPPLQVYLLAVPLIAFKPLMPLYAASSGGPFFGSDWPQTAHAFRYLFLLKAWYLPFDLLTAWLLLRLGGQRAFQFWWLNPFVIYTGYIHGQSDLLPACAVAVAFWQASRCRGARACFWLGIGASLKLWPFFLLPLAVILLARTWRQAAVQAVAGLAPYVLLQLPRWLEGAVGARAVLRQVTGPTDFVFPAALSLYGREPLYLFVAGYVVLLWWAYERRGTGFDTLWRVSLAVLLLYYSLGYAPLYYFSWAMPLAALFYARRPRTTLPWVGFGAAALGLSLAVGRSTAGGLLAPLSPAFFLSLPAPAEWLERFIEVNKVVGLARSLLAGTALWIAWQTLHPAGNVNHDTE